MKQKISKTNKKVLKMIIELDRPVRAEDLIEYQNLNLQSLRYSLKTLCDSNLIERIPDLNDLRSFFYCPNVNAYALMSQD